MPTSRWAPSPLSRWRDWRSCSGFLVGAFPEQPLEVEVPAAERQVTFGVARPLVFGTVPGQLEAVLVRVAQVERLVGAVVVHAVERPVGRHQPAQRVAERGPGRVANGDVVQPSRAGRGWRATFGFPRVEAKVVVI